MRLRHPAVTVILLAGACSVRAQISGTAEAYFVSNPQSHGVLQSMSWLEVNDRINPHFKSTFSYTKTKTMETFDEAYVAWQNDFNIVRAGRIRTAFGFSNWSELFYTGFTHGALVRMRPINGRLGLGRDDTGVEATLGTPSLQWQTAIIDTQADRFRWVPSRFRAATVRLQSLAGPVIVGGDILDEFAHGTGIAGVDLRWTAPRLQVRGEWMSGYGATKIGSGYYIDAAYRPFGWTWTQAVARNERFESVGGQKFQLNTLGVHQLLTQTLSCNVNYGWGHGDASVLGPTAGFRGFSLRAMYQVTF